MKNRRQTGEQIQPDAFRHRITLFTAVGGIVRNGK